MPADGPGNGTRPVRFAIVEDGAEYRRRLAELIGRTSGWDVVARCATVGRAVAEIPDLRPDVVLLDICLGGESGVGLVPELKRRVPDATIVMLTVVEDPETIVAALTAGASAYIVKGSDEDLIGSLRDVVVGGAGMSPAVARRLVGWFQKRGGRSTSEAAILSERQWEVLKLAARGRQHGEIAEALAISPHTVKNHFRSIYEKLGVGSLTEALIKVKGGRSLLDD